MRVNGGGSHDSLKLASSECESDGNSHKRRQPSCGSERGSSAMKAGVLKLKDDMFADLADSQKADEESGGRRRSRRTSSRATSVSRWTA